MLFHRRPLWLLALLVASPGSRAGPGPADVAVAIRRGDVGALEAYLSAGGDPSAADSGGGTLLHHAAEAGNAGAVDALLRAGADPHARNGTSSTPLHLAAARNRVEAARILLDFGTPVDIPGFTTRDGVAASTPLILAAELGSLDVARLLVERGADVNVVNNFGRTPLFWARKARQAELVKFLEGEGAVADPEEALARGGHRSGDGSTTSGADGASSAGPPTSSGGGGPGVLAISVSEPSEVESPSGDESIERLRRAVKANPGDPRALLRLGVAYRKTGASRRAARALLRVVELAPRSSVARAQLALALRDLGRPEAARKQLRALEALDPGLARRLHAVLTGP